jgi:hypothetical protein
LVYRRVVRSPEYPRQFAARPRASTNRLFSGENAIEPGDVSDPVGDAAMWHAVAMVEESFFERRYVGDQARPGLHNVGMDTTYAADIVKAAKALRASLLMVLTRVDDLCGL